MQKDEDRGACNGKLVYIIGPRSLQNDLLAFFLEQKTGATCVTGEDFSPVRVDAQAAPEQRPLVLLDCHGKDLEGIWGDIESGGRDILSEAYVALFNLDPELKVEEEAVIRNIRGFFYEPDSQEPLLKGVRAIFEGEFWVSRAIMSKCIGQRREQDVIAPGAVTRLTSRETEILAMVAVGIKNEEIADRLCISPHTVKTHIYNIFKKISVPNRLQAALWAAKHL